MITVSTIVQSGISYTCFRHHQYFLSFLCKCNLFGLFVLTPQCSLSVTVFAYALTKKPLLFPRCIAMKKKMWLVSNNSAEVRTKRFLDFSQFFACHSDISWPISTNEVYNIYLWSESWLLYVNEIIEVFKRMFWFYLILSPLADLAETRFKRSLCSEDRKSWSFVAKFENSAPKTLCPQLMGAVYQTNTFRQILLRHAVYIKAETQCWSNSPKTEPVNMLIVY